MLILVRLTQLKDLDIPWVILGHSERRTLFHETDELVAHKVRRDFDFLSDRADSGVQTQEALKVGIDVILCVGENLAEREGEKTTEVVTRQLAAVVKLIKEEDWKYVPRFPVCSSADERRKAHRDRVRART